MTTLKSSTPCTNSAKPAQGDRTIEELQPWKNLKLEAFEPGELQQLLCTLHSRQIELETQNAALHQIQSELVAEKERYFDFYHLAPLGYAVVNRQGLLLEANPFAVTLLKISQDDLIYQPITRFIHSRSLDDYERHHQQLFETRQTQTFELRMLKMDNTWFWAQVSAFLPQNNENTPMCRMTITDVTDRKFQKEQEILTAHLLDLINRPTNFSRNISQLTSSLHEWSGCEAIGIRLKDGDDYPYYETRGFPLEFVRLESNLCSFGPDGNIRRDAKGDPMLDCMCGNVLCGRFNPAKSFFTAGGSFCSNSTTNLLATTSESDRQARTRNRCNGAGYESVALIPIHTDMQVFGLIQLNDHQPDRFTPDMIVHFEKIADRLAIALSQHQAEKELLENRTILEAALSSMSDAVFISDNKGRFTHFNDAFATFHKFTSKDQCAETLAEYPALIDVFMADGSLAPVEQWVVSRALRGESGVNVEYLLRRKDTGETWVGNYNFAPIRNEKGEIVGSVVTGHDITEIKQAQKALQVKQQQLEALNLSLEKRVRDAVNELRQKDQTLIQQNRLAAMGEMIGNIAHQWRQPLNTLGLIVTNIQDAYQFNELDAEFMDKAVADCHRLIQKMSSTISDFFHFFRPNKVISAFSAQRQVEMAISLVQASFINNNIAINLETGRDAQLLGIPNEYSQVLLNLLSNARDAIMAQQCAAGRVDIFIETTGHMGCVVLRDNGGGIPENIIEKIFDPYFTTRPQGTGIGLYMSKMIVERNMNGGITARNVAGGVEFTVCIPLAE